MFYFLEAVGSVVASSHGGSKVNEGTSKIVESVVDFLKPLQLGASFSKSLLYKRGQELADDVSHVVIVVHSKRL